VLIQQAVRNNAELCDIVSGTHGVTGVFATDAWTSPRRTPPLYPDAVTLEPGIATADLLARIDNRPGCSVKDSFADLDLRADGFEVLFSAEWIHRPAQTSTAAASARWAPIADDRALAAWASAWAGADDPADLFRPALLRHPDIVLLGAMIDGDIVAGALLNRSAEVVGLSNVFVTTAAPDDVWPGCLDAITATFPGVPIVGYEPGESLETALHYGFASLGPLRVWIIRDGP
jgi:hypothetical protein